MQPPPRLHRQPATSPSLLVAAALLAFGVPSLMPFNLPPSPTVVNQLAAWIGWGAVAWLACRQVPAAATPSIRSAGVAALVAALLLLVGAALVAPLWTGLPWGIALSSTATLAAVLMLVAVGATVAGSGFEAADAAGTQLIRALMIGLVVIGLLHVAIAAVQVFAPRLADGFWIAAPASPGRASSNLRQPNHLSTLLLWSAIAAVWIVEAAPGRLERIRGAGLALLPVFTLGITLTASRTGALGVLLLAAWGMLDRRLGRATRIALLLLPLAYLVFWWLLSLWSPPAGEPGFADRSGALGEDPTRLAIWTNTIELIRAHPWAGVGVGEFNFAWTLTPFADRPQLFFDHAHNLPLQLLAELGLPLGALVLALLGHALWRAFAGARAARGASGLARRCALLLLLVAALHSLLEYPLWYAHFLLPVALWFGLCLGEVQPRTAAPARRPWLAWAALALMLGGVLGLHDYTRVAVIFAPGAAAVPLPERIAEGRRSWFFAHHADYARVTVAEPPPAPAAFDRVVHHLLDGRLLIAWARSLAASGDLPRAQHVVARLREFRQLRSDAFFAACAAPPVAAAAPFQCRPPPASLSAADFR